MSDKTHEERRDRSGQQHLMIWGVSALAAIGIFAALLVFLLLFGRISAAGAIAWAAGTALVTLVIVAATGVVMYRLPQSKAYGKEANKEGGE